MQQASETVFLPLGTTLQNKLIGYINIRYFGTFDGLAFVILVHANPDWKVWISTPTVEID